MKYRIYILLLIISLAFLPRELRGQAGQQNITFDFYGDTIEFPANEAAMVSFATPLSRQAVHSFYEHMICTDYEPIIDALLAYKQLHHPDDWVFYQLIRRTAQSMSPKADNYVRYTLYKWFLLNKTGYDAMLNTIDGKALLYVQSNEDIYDLPTFIRCGKQYICLNYHDYNFNIDFAHNEQENIAISIAGANNSFSYRLTQLPDFRPQDYYDKDLAFNYHDVNYHFKLKMNEEVKKMYVNYPVVDYYLYFNLPLSKETYNTLIPQLKENIKDMPVKQGIDYLMHFTRYAFLYEPDQENFGREKHLSPEQTLLYDHSDCEDRAALFYYLVKEIYNLPMIVLAFPHHLTIAVKFDQPIGKPIIFKGGTYSVCEPTPQKEDLPVGGLSSDLQTVPFEVAYAYDPGAK